jgi:glycosyltransferase involved in cell wall biosynthesis
MNAIPKISAVLIMKNEEVLLPRVLSSLQGIDEIILCDTGSSDQTVEIAKRYVKEVHFFEWCDDFAKARNHAKSFATGDWILSIDCDEILHDVSKVREAVVLAEQREALAVNVRMVAEDLTKQTFFYPRLFKNDPRVWWEGAIHNHVSVQGIDVGDVTITYGYSPAHFKDPHRAFRILQRVVKETGNGREMFYLGREYFYRAQFDECVKMMGQYVQKSKYLAEKADAFLIMARAYWAMKMPDDARDALVQAIIINAHFKEALLFMAELAGKGSGNEAWEKNAAQWERMAETADNTGTLFVRNV